jgi:hypothetical protein
MKPNVAVNSATRVMAAFTLFLSCTLLLPAQSNKKTAPPAQNSAPAKAAPARPAPAANAQQRPAQTQQRPGQPQARAGQTQPRPGQPVANSANRAATQGKTTAQGRTTTTQGRPGTPNGAQPGGRATVKNSAPTTAARVASPTPAAQPKGIVRTAAGPNGSTRGYDNKGNLAHVTTRSGAEAQFGPGHQVTTIRTASGTTITRVRTGPRVVAGDRVSPGGVHYRVVNTGRDRVYVARSFSRGNRVYERRTYVVGGRTYVTVYRGYGYRGHVYYGYVPAYYYHPGFYGWAYNPWGAPVAYAWGWNASPWYGAYGYYWTPYPVYPSAAFWLTDYLVAQNLQAAYDARAAAASDPSANGGQGDSTDSTVASNAPAPLTEETKRMIADEVRAQIKAEQDAAAQAPPTQGGTAAPAVDQAPPALDPSLKVFIVSTSMDVTADGQSCALSAGDILMRTEDAPGSDDMVGVKVVSSQKSDCAGGSAQRIQVADLQEMHNHFREQMDNGMKLLAEKQGKNGLPAAPAGSGRSNAEGVAAEDINVTADLKKQQEEADQAEKDVQQASSTSASSGDN